MTLKPFFASALNKTKRVAHDFAEAGLDVWTAIAESRAMSSRQRHLDEFKIVAGAVIAGFGALELNPLVTAGGAIPAVEAANEFREAGHRWRVHHPHHRL